MGASKIADNKGDLMTNRRMHEELIADLRARAKGDADFANGGFFEPYPRVRPQDTVPGRAADALERLAAGIADTAPTREAPVTDAEVEAVATIYADAEDTGSLETARAALEAARLARMGAGNDAS